MTRTKPSWMAILVMVVVLMGAMKVDKWINSDLIISHSERLHLIEACNRGEEEALEDYRNLIHTHMIVVSDGPVAKQLWLQVLPHLPFPMEIYKPLTEREGSVTMIALLALGCMIMTKVSNIFRSWKKEVPAPQQTTVYCNYDRYRY